MRFVSYGDPGRERAGMLVNDEVLDLEQILPSRLRTPTLAALFELQEWRALAHQALQTARGSAQGSGQRVDRVRLGAPIPLPGNVIVVGANTHSHVREAAQLTLGAPPLQPMILAKAPTAVCGPNDSIVRPRQTSKLDYEVELGVVIGRRARHVREHDALEVIAGVTVVNDVSARDVQLAENETNAFYRTHYLGKSFDSFCPCGPCLVTLDELPPLETLPLRTRVNGQLRQDSTVADLVFSVPALVSYLSSIFTLQPGDLICSGSPAGVAAFMSPPGYLVNGDLVECEVEGIGALRNRIVDEARE